MLNCSRLGCPGVQMSWGEKEGTPWLLVLDRLHKTDVSRQSFIPYTDENTASQRSGLRFKEDSTKREG